MLEGWTAVHRTALSVLASLEDILLQQSFGEICMTLRQPIAMNEKYDGHKQFQITRKMLRKMERKIMRREEERREEERKKKLKSVERVGVAGAEEALNSGGGAESSNLSSSTTPPTTPRH